MLWHLQAQTTRGPGTAAPRRSRRGAAARTFPRGGEVDAASLRSGHRWQVGGSALPEKNGYCCDICIKIKDKV